MEEIRFYKKGDAYYAEHPDGRKFRVKTDDESVARSTVIKALSNPDTAAKAAGEAARGMADAAKSGYDKLTAKETPLVEPPIEGAPRLGTPEREAWEAEQQRMREERKRGGDYIYDPSNTTFGEYGSGLAMGAIGAKIGGEMARPIAPMPYIGAPAQVLGPMIGGTIGYGYGLYQSEIVPRIAQSMGLMDENVQMRNLDDVRNEILDKMGVDITVQAGLSSLLRSLAAPGRMVYDKLSGLTPEAMKLINDAAQQFGVKLGRVNVATNPLISGYNKVLGRFPFVGTPSKRQGQRLRGEFEDAFRSLYTRNAPILTMPEASSKMVQAANKRYGSFMKQAGKYYDDYRAVAATEGEIVPTNIIEDGVLRAAHKLRNLELRDEKIPSSLQEAVAKVEAVLSDTLTQTNGRQAITVEELDGIYEFMEAALRNLKVEGKYGGRIKNALSEFGTSLEAAERSIRPDSEAAQALKKADTFYAKFMGLFDQPVAQKFKREDPTAFRSRLSMTKEQARPKFEADEIYGMVFSTKSAEAQRTLRKIVGPAAYKDAVGTHLEKVLSDSIVDGVFKPKLFAEGIGFGGDQAKANALTAAIDAAGIPRQRLELISKIAQKLEASDLQDISTFVQRRAILGGIGAVAGAGVVGGGAAGGTVTAMAIPVLLRWAGGKLNEPVYDQMARRLARYEPGTQTFRNTLTRLVTIGTRDLASETEEERRQAEETVRGAVRGAERLGKEFMQGYGQ